MFRISSFSSGDVTNSTCPIWRLTEMKRAIFFHNYLKFLFYFPFILSLSPDIPFFASPSPLFRPVAAETPDLYQELSAPIQHFSSPSSDSNVGQNLKLTDWESPERPTTTETTKRETEGLQHLLPGAQQLTGSCSLLRNSKSL